MNPSFVNQHSKLLSLYMDKAGSDIDSGSHFPVIKTPSRGLEGLSGLLYQTSRGQQNYHFLNGVSQS